jgi:uncharacterized protein (TIGR02996 family)
VITTDIEGMLALIAANPEDWPSYAVTADALEESGDTEGAECLRWAAREGKRAWSILDYPSRAVWYAGARVNSDEDPESNLPTELFRALTGHGAAISHVTLKHYHSPRAALDALLGAWKEARAAGWSPDTKRK